jgi:hypothetical protein
VPVILVRFWWNLDFTTEISNFMKNPPSGNPVVACGKHADVRTGRHEEINSRFSQLCERALKMGCSQYRGNKSNSDFERPIVWVPIENTNLTLVTLLANMKRDKSCALSVTAYKKIWLIFYSIKRYQSSINICVPLIIHYKFIHNTNTPTGSISTPTYPQKASPI